MIESQVKCVEID